MSMRQMMKNTINNLTTHNENLMYTCIILLFELNKQLTKNEKKQEEQKFKALLKQHYEEYDSTNLKRWATKFSDYGVFEDITNGADDSEFISINEVDLLSNLFYCFCFCIQDFASVFGFAFGFCVLYCFF